MTTKQRSPVELRRAGFQALVERLGPADAIRFLQQYETGEGDYTAERDAWLGSLTVEQLVSEIAQREGSRKNGTDQSSP